MRLIKEVEIVFENCEVAILPIEVIGSFHIMGIHDEIHRIACNAIGIQTIAYEVAFELFQEADTINKCEDNSLSVSKPIERIQKNNDIVALNIIYDDGNEQYIYVDYSDNDKYAGEENKNQKTHISSDGVLYVVISNNKGIYDFFKADEMGNVRLINLKKTMIGTYDLNKGDNHNDH